MNSAGLTGAMPMTVTTWPWAITSSGFVSASHFTKNASSGVAPISAPSRHSTLRKAPMSRRMCFQSVASLGSKTIQLVPSAIDSSTITNRRRTLR
jgi:hypothetical protein